MNTAAADVRPGRVVSGPTLPEPIEVLAVVPMGDALKLVGRGRSTRLTHGPIRSPAQIAELTVSADREPFGRDAQRFRLGVEAQRLALAYEDDPFFSLSIARVDPLPHQLEAVYGHFRMRRGMGRGAGMPWSSTRRTSWRGGWGCIWRRAGGSWR